MNEQIERNFSYHAPKEGQPEVYEAIRSKAKEFAYLIHELVADSREKSLAMTNLEQTVFWANAAVARDESVGISIDEDGIHISGNVTFA